MLQISWNLFTILLFTNRGCDTLQVEINTNHMGKFKKGMFLGGLLGAGLVWLNTTKKGKQVRDQVLDHAAEIFAELREKLEGSKEWDNLTKSKYAKIAKAAVEKYASKNGIPANVAGMITKLVTNQWKNLKK